MSPTRRNGSSVPASEIKKLRLASSSYPRLERLEDRWNPAGIWGPSAVDLVQPIVSSPAISDVAIVDSKLLGRIPVSELRGSKVIAIDGRSDPIDQIDRALAGLADISVLRIISHGESGALWLGGERIDLATLKGHSAEIKSWSKALTADADLLLYGCSVGATSQGQRFIENLAGVTGADVAASTDITGALGDVDLERATGSIEHTIKSGIKAWSDGHLNLAFTNLSSARFYAEQGNTFTLMSDLP